VLLRHCEDVLLGGGVAGDGGWSGVQRLRSDNDLLQLPSQRQRKRTSSTAARLSRSHRLQHEPNQEVGDAVDRLEKTTTKKEAR